jgi:sugar-specific transcriptional regulator TrmB
MSVQTDNYINLVKPFGLSDEEGKIYLHLLQNGLLTALQLSKALHLGRTKTYRILDVLHKKQLVEFVVRERGLVFGATSPKKFDQLLLEQESKLQVLRQQLTELVELLQQLGKKSDKNSKVVYYEGIEGLKQVSYNITNAVGLVRVFEMEHLSDFLPLDFAELVRYEMVEKGISVRDLTNKRTYPGYTNVTDLVSSHAESRYIDPQKLQINFEVLIYNEVYATYSYKDDRIFCVEIYNAQLAEMQKQLFDFIWNQAVPMRFTDKRGAATVVE